VKIGITGSAGLLGTHARACLHAQGRHEVVLATRETFASPQALDDFVSPLDGILHFAGVNRGESVLDENIWIAHQLTAALRRTAVIPAIAYANSLHFMRDSKYGQGKRLAGECLEAWGRDSAARVGNFILPHVFGEFGRPLYNSVVSTFCHQLAHGEETRIETDGQLELLHAQAVVEQLVAWLGNQDAPGGVIPLHGVPMSVSDLLGRLRGMRARYLDDAVIPNLSTPFDLGLFNTFRSYLYPNAFPRGLTLRSDARGELFEAIRTDNGGQVFLSTTVPGVTRGNHWHLNKVERFLVIGGEAVIRIRRLFSDDVVSYSVSGTTPAYVDIPTMHVHSITNTGDQTLQTLFWAHEIFDPEHADTYPEAVLA
jgi:UDP-2-acetamido-2,6-beta-L-arabino-hexul-4-ose reductase